MAAGRAAGGRLTDLGMLPPAEAASTPLLLVTPRRGAAEGEGSWGKGGGQVSETRRGEEVGHGLGLHEGLLDALARGAVRTPTIWTSPARPDHT